MEQDCYVSYLQEIKAHLGDRKVIYVPHRGETKRTKDLVRSVTGFEIAHFGVPIEYKICVDGPLPETICAFFSSALMSCRRILGDLVNITSFYIENDHFLRNNQRYANLYSFLEKQQGDHFQVVRLNNDDTLS